MERVRYVVTATLASADVLDEYTGWLSGGHIQAVVDEGGALSGEYVIHMDDPEVKVSSIYEFPDMSTYEAYCSNVAPKLRAEGVALFVETNKVIFQRILGKINFSHTKSS